MKNQFIIKALKGTCSGDVVGGYCEPGNAFERFDFGFKEGDNQFTGETDRLRAPGKAIKMIKAAYSASLGFDKIQSGFRYDGAFNQTDLPVRSRLAIIIRFCPEYFTFSRYYRQVFKSQNS